LYSQYNLRIIIFGGEKMAVDSFAVMSRQVEPQTLLVNAYGPAECTIASTLKVNQI
jgi:hypothetical protein